MSSAVQDLQSFYKFADERLRDHNGEQSLDQLYAEWRAENPTAKELEENVLAVRASLRDIDDGIIGRPVEEFEREFRERNGL
ncbi:MAG TPA: hypothetical protein VFW73_08145 [Lacipirellulaceae bacterium]|nr:hypothetical protein [Lacipirellulaceae bacterium]